MRRDLCWMVVIILLIRPCIVGACPVYLTKKSFFPDLPESPRKDFFLFTIEKGRWKAQPLQIDPVDDNLRFSFFRDNSFLEENLGEYDRISFSSSLFGERYESSMSPPCQTDYIYELSNLKNKGEFAYFANCLKFSDEDIAQSFIKHDPLARRVISKLYDYKYHEDNHMMFERISVKSRQGGILVAGENSAQRIRIDVRNFFTLNFSSSDIESKLSAVREGPVALLGNLTFFLKILFFKIDLQLNTAVSFFEDSVHLPMTINMPLNAVGATHPKTGMNFSWEIPENVEWLHEKSSMPIIQPDLISKGYKPLSELGLKNCRGSSCVYSLVGSLDEFTWGVEFILPRHLVERGFFPMFMDHSGKNLMQLDWNDHDVFKKRNIGIYYETSGLPKGQHEFDFWIKMGNSQLPIERVCPHPSRVVRRIKMSSLTGK